MSAEPESSRLLNVNSEVSDLDDASTITQSSTQSTVKSLSELSELINPTRSILYLILLTIVIGGLQLSWCTEFSEGTPFLLSLGISKQVLALVWIAGPLSGTLGQPIVGIYSDNCTSSYGRRRPFIIGGCIATCFSLWYLSHSIDIIKFFIRGDHDAEYYKLKTIPFAAFGVYLLDFSISVIQAATRAFIIDNVPTHQQQIANAWAARMIGFFNIIGYFLSSIELVKYFPFLGDTQFKVLAGCAALALVITSAVSCLYVKERNPKTDVIIKSERKKQQQILRELGVNEAATGVISVLKSLWKQTVSSYFRCSPQVKMVNFVEFLAWVGYFPMLFYTTTYVGELYQMEYFADKPAGYQLAPGEKDQLLEDSTRRGSTALLVHGITSLVIDLLLPALIKPHEIQNEGKDQSWFVKKLKSFKSVQQLTVAKVWTWSHLVFVVCMISTFFITTSNQAIWMFGILGIPWGCALWAPFVLISEEVSRIKEIKAKGVVDHYSSKLSSRTLETGSTSSDRTPKTSSIEEVVVSPRLLEKYDQYSYEPGIILGIHNMAVASPQVLSSLMSSLLFKLLSHEKQLGDFDSSLGWVYRFGGVFAIGAWILSFKVKTWDELMEDDRKEIESGNV